MKVSWTGFLPGATLVVVRTNDGKFEVFIDPAIKYGKPFQPPPFPRRREPNFFNAAESDIRLPPGTTLMVVGGNGVFLIVHF